ncbi:hypothetical protein FRC12_010713 [Ceratobasidium sp. 428]|nr:hypothetical protein FRC12_010713 [Ceratobasidium sp. 428]
MVPHFISSHPARMYIWPRHRQKFEPQIDYCTFSGTGRRHTFIRLSTGRLSQAPPLPYPRLVRARRPEHIENTHMRDLEATHYENRESRTCTSRTRPIA